MNICVDPKPEVKILNNQMSKLKESRNKTYPASGVTLKVALIGPRKAGKTRIANQVEYYSLCS